MFCTKLLKMFGIILGASSLTGLLTTGIYYIHKYEEMNCGDLQIGVAVGIGSLASLLINFLLYICTCCTSGFRKFIISICSLLVVVSFIYNFYLYIDIEDSCKEYYETKNIWDFYKYFIIVLSVNTLLILVMGIVYCNIKKD
jgi:hypothetical protein